MRKHYLYLVFIFLTAFSSFAQKVTLTPTSVNGSAFGGTINLGGTPYSSISLGVKVDMPTIPDNNGTVTVYVVSGLNPTIAIGGNNIPLFFGGTKSATQSLVININWGSISTLGGQLYAEYKTSAGLVYRSGSVAITKSATMSGGGNPQAPADAPNPANIANSLCCNQTIRLGDKPVLINGSEYANPYKNEPYGINSLWLTNGNGSVRFNNLDPATQALDIDYVTTLGNFTITRSLGYNYSNEKPNKSNAVTITVVPSPIMRNLILTNDPANQEGFIELSSLKKLTITGESSIVNLKVLQDPFYVIQPRDPGTNVDGYKWEYKNSKYSSNPWITIPHETNSSLEFSDPSQFSNSEDVIYSVRRIAIYQNISQVSNEIKILVRGLRFDNTICCDQNLEIKSLTQYEAPTTINGSTAILDTDNIKGTIITDPSISYQWQLQTLSNGTSAWTDILGATSKNYLPNQSFKIIENRRGNEYIFESSYNYRRIAKFTYMVNNNDSTFFETKSSYSNEVLLNGSGNPSYIKIYPNPATSIINIENTNFTFRTNTLASVINSMGETVNSNFTFTTPSIISINISNLPIGLYFINLELSPSKITKLTFIKQ